MGRKSRYVWTIHLQFPIVIDLDLEDTIVDIEVLHVSTTIGGME